MITYVRPSAPDTFLDMVSWLERTFVFGFDIETNVTDHPPDRVIDTMQFGSWDQQFVFRWHELNEGQEQYVRKVLASHRWVKIIHNALFEGGVLYRHGILLDRIYDTMLAEMVLHAGIIENWPALLDLVWMYAGVWLDKDDGTQLSFGHLDQPLTDRQIEYACGDVKYLGVIYDNQLLQLHQADLEWVMALENDAVLGYAEMMDEGVELDVQWWLGLQEKALPIVEAARKKMDEWCLHPDLKDNVPGVKMIANEDIVELPVNSPKYLLKLLQWFAPDLTGTSKAVITKWVSKNSRSLPQEHAVMLQAFAAGDKEPFCNYLLAHHRDELIQLGHIIPQGTCLINWGSPVQVLPLAQRLHKGLQSLDKEALGRTHHPFFLDLLDWRNTAKLITTYGEEFVRKHTQKDGRVRTRYNPMVDTGRCSSSSPNLQNIPAKEPVGPVYRNAFVAPEGWVFEGADFSGQEVVLLAYLSQDPVWLQALRENKDLHSIVGELIFKKKWVEGAEEGCAYYTKGPDGKPQQQKCSCKKHKGLRESTKTLNFG